MQTPDPGHGYVKALSSNPCDCITWTATQPHSHTATQPRSHTATQPHRHSRSHSHAEYSQAIEERTLALAGRDAAVQRMNEALAREKVAIKEREEAREREQRTIKERDNATSVFNISKWGAQASLRQGRPKCGVVSMKDEACTQMLCVCVCGATFGYICRHVLAC